MLAAGTHLLPDGLSVDAAMGASQLVLRAAPDASVILCADITLSVGLLVLDGLGLRGAAPSRARFLSESASVPAVVVSGGMLTMRGSSMKGYVFNGALHVLGGEVNIEGSLLADNSAIGLQGGAILVNGGRLSLIRSTMSRNEAEEGGAVAVLAGRFDAAQCGFEANTYGGQRSSGRGAWATGHRLIRCEHHERKCGFAEGGRTLDHCRWSGCARQWHAR